MSGEPLDRYFPDLKWCFDSNCSLHNHLTSKLDHRQRALHVCTDASGTIIQEIYPTTSMTLMKRQIWYLHLLMHTSSTDQRRVLLDTITNDQLKALTEVTHNILQGNIPLTEAHKRKLRKEKSFLHILGDIKVPLVKKREALCRKADIVVLLLKAAEPRLKLFL